MPKSPAERKAAQRARQSAAGKRKADKVFKHFADTEAISYYNSSA
ncbi:TPA: hypothetical protein ACRR3Z_004473 [Klebsiella quasipneumoniae]